MNDVLKAVTAKLNSLDDVCAGVDTKVCIGAGDGSTDGLLIPVPPTDVGRALLRALLVEIGRHEQEQIESQLRVFKTAADSLYGGFRVAQVTQLQLDGEGQ